MSGSVLVRVPFDQVTCMAAPTLEYPVDGADPRRASSGSQCTPTWQPVATRSIMLAGALRSDSRPREASRWRNSIYRSRSWSTTARSGSSHPTSMTSGGSRWTRPASNEGRPCCTRSSRTCEPSRPWTSGSAVTAVSRSGPGCCCRRIGPSRCRRSWSSWATEAAADRPSTGWSGRLRATRTSSWTHAVRAAPGWPATPPTWSLPARTPNIQAS